MKILAIDTSSKICSVAILEDEKTIIELHSEDEKTHSINLMPMIDKALQISNLNLNDIDLLACCVGPGSFTGIRIGIATIKAFADSKNIQTIGISSLEGLAYNLVTLSEEPLQNSNDTLVCSIIDAKNSNAYCSCFNFENNICNQIGDLIAEDINEIIEYIKTCITKDIQKITFIGDGAIIYKDILSSSIKNIKLQFASQTQNINNSISIAYCAYIKYLNNHNISLNSLSPIYLRKPQAQRSLENKKSEN